MFGWLSRREKEGEAPERRATQALIAEGNEAEAAGDARRARLCYERALVREPRNAAANYNLGRLLYADGAAAEAERLLAQALAAREDFPEARIIRGYALHALGRLEDAAGELRTGLRGRPDDLHARATLFHVLDAKGDAAGAAAQLEAMLGQRPDWPEALFNYGSTLLVLKRDAEAESALRRVLALEPTFAVAYRMLGSLLHRQGRIDETIDLCRAGQRALPDNLDLESFELLALNFSDRVSADELFERHVAFGRRLEATCRPRFAFAKGTAAKRPLRVGYVSADLNYHPVGLFLLPVLEHHDREKFAAHCYATGPQADDFTRRLRGAAAAWCEAHALSDDELAARIRADDIDILVDLAGHSGVSRLGVFALKPAPVQAAWLGYLNTTGLTRIDHRITDGHCDPPGAADARHTEALVRLPASQWCYRPFVDLPTARELPHERNGFVTFGSFTQTAKLSPATLRIWAGIFRAAPAARLLIAGVAPGLPAERLRAALQASGIDGPRIEMAPFLPVNQYLGLYERVDIALDPVPYSGGTTTCDALWMGVPVITLPGERSASRSAAGILACLGLDEWIARDAEDYVERALRFARDPALLRTLRATLRERMRASPLTDELGFTRQLEAAFERMWQTWCRGSS